MNIHNRWFFLFLLFCLGPNYLFSQNENLKKYIGYIKVIGPIDSSSIKYAEQIQKAANNESIAGLIIVIDSPGGDIGIGDYIYHELKHYAAKKPVFVAIANQCCSAAYLIASAAQKIFAPALAEIGSIGVFIEVRKNIQPTIRDEGGADVLIKYLYAGKHKIEFMPTTPLSKEIRDYTQQSLNQAYDYMCNEIAQNRHLSLENKTNWAEGMSHFGFKALDLGLIDQIGSFTDTEQLMKALLKEKNIEYPETIDFLVIS